MAMRLIILLSVLLHLSHACTKPAFSSLATQSNFDLSQFLGIWYEIQWLPGEPHNESTIWRDFYQSYNLESGSSDRLEVPGKARTLSDVTCFSIGPWAIVANNSAKMILERRGPIGTPVINWPFYVITTDYSNYALIFGCTTDNYVPTNPCVDPILWVFGRRRTLAETHLTMINRIIANDLCVNLTHLEITPHGPKSCYTSSSSNGFNHFLAQPFYWLFFYSYFGYDLNNRL